LKAAPPRAARIDRDGRLTNCDHQPAAEPTEASRDGNFGSECRAAMKRYSTMVKQDGSDDEIELCQVDSNPKKVAEAAVMRGLGQEQHSRRIQLLLPFVTYCGRFSGTCPLTDRSSIADVYCYRCSCIAPGSFLAR